MDISSSTHWLFRYKIHHLLFWVIYHFTWSAIYKGSVGNTFYNLLSTPALVTFLAYVIFQAIGVYFCLYFLVPKFLERGHYITFLCLLLITLIGISSAIYASYFMGAYLSGESITNLYGLANQKTIYLFKAHAFPASISSMTLGMSIHLAKKWLASQQRRQALEKEKLETELKFLRSQFNPHFLFNTINSIFVLIHKNPKMASDALSKFSDLLRYQLYECNAPKIPLKQELSYLKNFIELEKLRHDCHHLELTLEIQESINPNLMIAPFILIPFLENAFKHVSKQKDQTNSIHLRLELKENLLCFVISNSVSEHMPWPKEAIHHGGIGLQNVKRRLDLMYPNQHQLNIQSYADHFEVFLQLHL